MVISRNYSLSELWSLRNFGRVIHHPEPPRAQLKWSVDKQEVGMDNGRHFVVGFSPTCNVPITIFSLFYRALHRPRWTSRGRLTSMIFAIVTSVTITSTASVTSPLMVSRIGGSSSAAICGSLPATVPTASTSLARPVLIETLYTPT